MSWLSDRLGTTGKTPAIIKNIGKLAGGTLVNAVPFGLGGAVDKLFNVTGTQPSRSLSEIVDGTADNLNSQIDRANQANQAMNFLQSPVGLLAIGVLIYLLVRKK